MDDVFDDWPEPDFYDTEPEARHDPKVDEAAVKLLGFIEENPSEVFYEMQLEVIFEDDYFHWITTKALAQLRDARKIGSSLEVLKEVGRIRFYFHIKNRYWKRKAAEIRKLVEQFSEPALTRALGNQGELLVDAGLPSVGFLPRARDVNQFGDRQWTETKHARSREFKLRLTNSTESASPRSLALPPGRSPLLPLRGLPAPGSAGGRLGRRGRIRGWFLSPCG